MKDIVLVVAIVVAFAVLVTAHVAIAWGLAFRRPRWRSPVAFAMVPVAPFWAWRERMHVRAVVWVIALAVYATARLFAGG